MRWMRTDWMGIPRGSQSRYDHDQGVVRGLSLMLTPMIQYWTQYSLTDSSMTWMVGQMSPQQGFWWCKAGRSDQYPSVLCSPSGGPGEAGGMDWLKFSEGKSRIVHLGKNKLMYQHRLGPDLLESSTVEKELRVLVGNRLSMGQPVKYCCKEHPVLFCDCTVLHTTGHLILGWTAGLC